MAVERCDASAADIRADRDTMNGRYRLRLEWCQARAHWRVEWRSIVFSDENRFCLGARVGRVLNRRRRGKGLEPNCLWIRHTGSIYGMV
ncbi:transposable element Tc1 transposase [Trichonephila clavipes]|nr:transposable element Tc1 transposase [Trichonephila clavipes]